MSNPETCDAGKCPVPLKAQYKAIESIFTMLTSAVQVLSNPRAGPMCPTCPMLVVIRGWSTSAAMMSSLLKEQIEMERMR